MDYYWTETKGDTIFVHTTEIRCVAKFTNHPIAPQRGGGFADAEKDANAYCRALEAEGYKKRG